MPPNARAQIIGQFILAIQETGRRFTRNGRARADEHVNQDEKTTRLLRRNRTANETLQLEHEQGKVVAVFFNRSMFWIKYAKHSIFDVIEKHEKGIASRRTSVSSSRNIDASPRPSGIKTPRRLDQKGRPSPPRIPHYMSLKSC